MPSRSCCEVSEACTDYFRTNVNRLDRDLLQASGSLWFAQGACEAPARRRALLDVAELASSGSRVRARARWSEGKIFSFKPVPNEIAA